MANTQYIIHTLIMPRHGDYSRLLEQVDVTLARCVTAENLSTSGDGPEQASGQNSSRCKEHGLGEG